MNTIIHRAVSKHLPETTGCCGDPLCTRRTHLHASEVPLTAVELGQRREAHPREVVLDELRRRGIIRHVTNYTPAQGRTHQTLLITPAYRVTIENLSALSPDWSEYDNGYRHTSSMNAALAGII